MWNNDIVRQIEFCSKQKKIWEYYRISRKCINFYNYMYFEFKIHNMKKKSNEISPDFFFLNPRLQCEISIHDIVRYS